MYKGVNQNSTNLFFSVRFHPSSTYFLKYVVVRIRLQSFLVQFTIQFSKQKFYFFNFVEKDSDEEEEDEEFDEGINEEEIENDEEEELKEEENNTKTTSIKKYPTKKKRTTTSKKQNGGNFVKLNMRHRKFAPSSKFRIKKKWKRKFKN